MSADGLVRVGRIGKPHGLRGGVTIVPEGGVDAFRAGAALTTDDGRELVVRSSSPYRDRGLVVAFSGVDTRDGAEELRGRVLTSSIAARRPLAAGEYWEADLVGMTAVDPGGAVLGTISGIDVGVGQDRLVVSTPGGGEVLIPFVAALVGDPDEHGRIEIRDPGGLF